MVTTGSKITIQKQAQAIVLIEKLRYIESELFRLASKYGVKTVDDLDALFAKGNVSEEEVGEDLFLFDYLTEEKEKLETDLKKFSVKKNSVGENIHNLLGLQKWNFRI